MVNLQTIIDLLKSFKCEVQIVQTGHPEWARGFITFKGVQVGRIAIHNGEYSHIKWYRKSDYPLGDYGYPEIGIAAFFVHSVVISEKLYEWAKQRSVSLSLLHYQQKMKARNELHKTKLKGGKQVPIKRSAIKQSCASRYIMDAIALGLWGEFNECSN